MKNSVSVKKTRRGFTLVELVVVVLVLGVIAAIAAPKMFDTANDARENSTVQSLAVIRDAIELHRAQNGAYPGNSGTEADFKSDLTDFLKGAFPVNQVSSATGNGSVSVQVTGAALTQGGTSDWKYDNVTGDFIINSTGFSTL